MTLGPGLVLPVEAVTETFAILAKRGAGKTYTAAVLVEEMMSAGLPVVIIDPVGVWLVDRTKCGVAPLWRSKAPAG